MKRKSTRNSWIINRYVVIITLQRRKVVHRMKKFLVSLLFLTSSMLGCAPVTDSKVSKRQCNIALNGNVTKAQLSDRQIAFQHETSGVIYFNLSTNKFGCDREQNIRLLHAFEGTDASNIYLSASELHQNIKNINFSQSTMSSLSTADYAENFCKNIGFNYIFGLSDNGEEVIGCQPSELAQSAIMFKKTTETAKSVTIAALGIYTPIINNQLNSPK